MKYQSHVIIQNKIGEQIPNMRFYLYFQDNVKDE